jgi:anti-sigma regulatory factor (Ser/Thr protein kinase)
MEDLSLHILDVAENSIHAGATHIVILIRESLVDDTLTVEIEDNGEGMTSEQMAKASDPFYTTRTTRKVGLGLSLLDQAAKAANGTFEIESRPGSGTRVCATFQLSHVDCKPIGNMADTITALLARRPDIDITYHHERGGQGLSFSTKEIRRQLDDVPVNSPASLNFIRQYLAQEEDNLAHHV